MPSQRHEQAAQLLGLFVPRLAEELEIPYEPLGMTTWKKPGAEKGLEPDQCYYIQNQAVVREKEVLDLEVDPPPDLAIEVDITSSSLNRMGIYAELRVPEVWRFDGNRVAIFRLESGGYVESPNSVAFQALTGEILTQFLDDSQKLKSTAWLKRVREWARSQV